MQCRVTGIQIVADRRVEIRCRLPASCSARRRHRRKLRMYTEQTLGSVRVTVDDELDQVSKSRIRHNGGRSVIFFYHRCSGLYVAVALVGGADDPFRCDIAARYLERGRDRAVLEQAFSLAYCYGNYHQFERVDEIGFEKRLKHISTSEHVYIGAVRTFQFADVFREVPAQEN